MLRTRHRNGNGATERHYGHEFTETDTDERKRNAGKQTQRINSISPSTAGDLALHTRGACMDARTFQLATWYWCRWWTRQLHQAGCLSAANPRRLAADFRCSELRWCKTRRSRYPARQQSLPAKPRSCSGHGRSILHAASHTADTVTDQKMRGLTLTRICLELSPRGVSWYQWFSEASKVTGRSDVTDFVGQMVRGSSVCTVEYGPGRVPAALNFAADTGWVTDQPWAPKITADCLCWMRKLLVFSS